MEDYKVTFYYDGKLIPSEYDESTGKYEVKLDEDMRDPEKLIFHVEPDPTNNVFTRPQFGYPTL